MKIKNIIFPSSLFKKIFYYKSLDSTNNKAFSLKPTYEENFIVITDQQTKGKGRYNRTWYSPKNENFYFSLALFQPKMEYHQLLILTSLALLQTLQLYNQKLRIKWPNDILYTHKKISGILIENEFENSILRFSVIGIGINVGTDFSQNKELKDKAISLKYITQKKIKKEILLNQFLKFFEEYYTRYEKYKNEIVHEWKKSILYKNKVIHFKIDKKDIFGILKRINNDGSIIIKGKNIESRYSFGEVQ